MIRQGRFTLIIQELGPPMLDLDVLGYVVKAVEFIPTAFT